MQTEFSNYTLEELDPPIWNRPNSDTSYLIKTVHSLRSKKIKDFSVEDLRLMIGQEIGLKYLIPSAIEILEREPLAEGDYYPGDLLKMVLTINNNFWANNPEIFQKMHLVTQKAFAEINEIDVSDAIKNQLIELLNNFTVNY